MRDAAALILADAVPGAAQTVAPWGSHRRTHLCAVAGQMGRVCWVGPPSHPDGADHGG